MSDTFKFLDANKESNSAQDFLKKRMDSYTPEQQSMLEASGGAAVVNASEGVVPAGEAYAKYGKMPSTESSATSTTKAYSGADKRNEMYAEDTDFGRNYRAGIYGGGAYDKDALAAKFGLDNSAAAEAKGGEENVYGTLADGSQVFLGRMNEGLKSNSDLIKAHSKQRHQEEGDHLSEGGDLDSTGDVRGALLASWKAGDVQAAAEPEKERTPIEHSPEIKQAKERVRSYEDNVMSGKMSNDIFGNYGDTGLDLNKAEPPSAQATPTEQASTKATQSFLDNKKHETKLSYGFKPKANLAYGAE